VTYTISKRHGALKIGIDSLSGSKTMGANLPCLRYSCATKTYENESDPVMYENPRKKKPRKWYITIGSNSNDIKLQENFGIQKILKWKAQYTIIDGARTK
jgi:hypothetical protein